MYKGTKICLFGEFWPVLFSFGVPVTGTPCAGSTSSPFPTPLSPLPTCPPLPPFRPHKHKRNADGTDSVGEASMEVREEGAMDACVMQERYEEETGWVGRGGWEGKGACEYPQAARCVYIHTHTQKHTRARTHTNTHTRVHIHIGGGHMDVSGSGGQRARRHNG